MAKLAQAAGKYTIYARFEADGIVEKPDVIGAVFGQTEGLLGADMDLRELQRTGRIGRIDVELQIKEGKATGTIIIPSSLDGAETALIAACIETIDRVGPCTARLAIERIEDVRIAKRKFVVERGKELLSKIFEEGLPDIQALTEQLREAVRGAEIVEWQGLPSGPALDSYDSIIVVEGRADVVHLLKHGIKNVVAIEGTSVPKQIIELGKKKEITAFLDGDRGGDLILKELLATTELDFVARAPRGKEVEDLSKKELFKALRARVPSNQIRASVVGDEERRNVERREKEERKPARRLEPAIAKVLHKTLEELTGTRAAYLMKTGGEIIGKVPLRETFNALRELQADILVLDGDADQRLVNFAAQHGVKLIAAMKVSARSIPENIQIVPLAELESA